MLKLSDALAGWNPSQQKRAAYEPIALLEAGWGEIVGRDVADHSRPARIAGGTLTITTRSNAWSHQLSFLSDHVLRAVEARVPDARVEQLRFRVGRLDFRTAPRRVRRSQAVTGPPDRPPSACAAEALERFRGDVEAGRRRRRSAGWIACRGCDALLPPDAEDLCAACAVARAEELEGVTARLLFDAPWLGYAGTAALVDGLEEKEYERIRRRMLAHWWGMLARARTLGQLSRDGRERLIASSYVLLHSKLPPEEIMPATVRNILGDELHELLYAAPPEGGAGENRKRRT
ncbi:MAG: DUF721 domain-containing protein [Candidatus Eremiobacteraeota bacterium]|nr:DUF721 domain-containing protein [Candidatus Eremiobacteraeota bacterium]